MSTISAIQLATLSAITNDGTKNFWQG